MDLPLLKYDITTIFNRYDTCVLGAENASSEHKKAEPLKAAVRL